MPIKREDLDRGNLEYSDVASGRRLPPVHPGEILRDEFLQPLGLSVYRLAHSRSRGPGSTISCSDAGVSRRTPRCAWDATSA